MVHSVQAHILLRLGRGPVIVWLLVWPLLPPLCFVSGVLFTWLGSIRISRICLALEVMSLINAAVFFYFVAPYTSTVLSMLFLKLGLCCSLAVHIWSLENELDARCAQTKTTDTSFVEEMTSKRMDEEYAARRASAKRQPKRFDLTGNSATGADHDGDVCMTQLRGERGFVNASPF
mmetsp:Transcript_117141/g.314106  ORF Transcript_117141/g.314106 Transcript_117141/m.314106 type:complete len:176 (-) Transcript_117141:18-545(-)